MFEGWIAFTALLFCWKRVKRYLRYFQQEEYKLGRFTAWWLQNRAWDSVGTLIAAASFCLSFIYPQIAAGLGGFALALAAFCEENPVATGKVRLKMTDRAKRILGTAFLLLIVFQLVLLKVPFPALWIGEIALFQLTPLALIGAVLLLQKDEERRQAAFLKEAKERLSQVDPFVIGITGSYGKTSTKDALGRLLQVCLGPTFWPGQSINTPMGITREIREKLQPGYKYAVIEMGAYAEKSIQRLCDLTPPHAGIITAIGQAHLERFGSQEAVYKAKSELAQAIPQDGILVCNGDDSGARRMAQEYPKKTTLLYGQDPSLPLDCVIVDVKTIPTGTTFTLRWQEKEYQGYTPLFGKTALFNAVAAFTMACALGAHPALVVAALRNLEPVSNRLQVRQDGQTLYVHDAYNSNPQGFAAALEVLRDLPAQRRILMTPGMIELGTIQQSANEQVGKLAASTCDLALIVGDTNRDSLLSGLKQGGKEDQHLILCATRSEAFEKLAALKQDGDAILIENDLTDLYETPARF